MLLATAFMASAAAPGLAEDCTQIEADSQASLADVYNCHFDNDPHMVALAAQAAPAKEKAKEATKNANVPTTAPAAFAGRIHAGYEDFLNLLGFAVNTVEESKDGRALVVRFNPVRHGPHLLGGTLTASEPQLAKSLTDAIPAAQRAAVVEELKKRLEDTDDLTLSGSYSFQTPSCKLASAQRCWGRDPRTYDDDLGALLTDTPEDPQIFLRLGEALKPLVANGDAFQTTVGSLPAERKQDVLALIRQAAQHDAEATAAAKARYLASGIGNLATLMDNQPQLSLTGSYRDAGELVAPTEQAIALELHFGQTNLNSLYRACHGNSPCVAGRLRQFADDAGTLATDKFVLTASYTRRGAFDVKGLDLPAGVTADFHGLHVASGRELKVRLQWGRQITSNLGGRINAPLAGLEAKSDDASPLKARWDLTLDGLRTTKDGVRTANRWVANWTLTFPLSKQVSFPLTVSYANKPEFLTDQRHDLGAHLGISYKFPWEK
ncbi:MAG TPA: hypothetical protein VGV61_10295 [Thermoanaerobaculia bacterium]|nr:hypothetical protein [Thermoanaerobaculia bacterium]